MSANLLRETCAVFGLTVSSLIQVRSVDCLSHISSNTGVVGSFDTIHTRKLDIVVWS